MAPPPCKRFLCAQVFPGSRSFPGQRERGRSPSAAPPSPRSDIGGSFGDAHEIPDASSPGGEVFPDLACPPAAGQRLTAMGSPEQACQPVIASLPQSRGAAGSQGVTTSSQTLDRSDRAKSKTTCASRVFPEGQALYALSKRSHEVTVQPVFWGGSI